MTNRITRNKAAEILGVDKQTISNYIKDGLLGGYKDEKGFTYVNADDVDRYAVMYKFFFVSEKRINAKIDEIKQLNNDVCNDLAEARKALFHNIYSGLRSDSISRAISAIYEAGYIPNMTRRERDILSEFLVGKDARRIASDYELSIPRIQQILNKACRRIYEQTDIIRDNIRKGREAQEEVKLLKYKLKDLRHQYDEYRTRHYDYSICYAEPPRILAAKLIDYDLSVRALNCLKGADVETLGDLLMNYTSARKMRNLRNSGKKSIREIEEFVASLGLFFINERESKEEYYVRLNRALKDNNNGNKEQD